MYTFPLRAMGIVVIAGALFVNGCKDSSTQPNDGTSPPPASGVVSFSGFVLPTFNIYGCPTCHGGSGGLTLTSYQSLMAGNSNNGPVVIPGDGANSLIIRKLRGTGPGSQMPLGGTPLPDTTISTISAWIDQGALNN